LKQWFKIFSLACLCICASEVYSQTSLSFRFIHPDGSGDLSKSVNKLRLKEDHKDSLGAIKHIKSQIAALQSMGHIDASLDTITGSREALEAVIYFGQAFVWADINPGNLDEGMLNEAGLREKLIEGKPLSPEGLAKVNSGILTYFENHGYPFASLRYTDIRFNGNRVSATLDLDTENKITIDSIIVKGGAKLSVVYLENYLSLKPGDLYNESLIRSIPDRIKELPMVSEVRPFGITFTDEAATVVLYLDNKKASQIDGVIGILPDYQNQGKVQLTGDIRMRLLSSFGRGELFDLNWKNPQPQTQDLKIRINYPFLFSTPFGIDFSLGIYKKDTTFLDVNLNAGIQISLKGNNYFKVFINNKKSDLLSTSGYENITELPPYADVSVISYGVGGRAEKLDYRFNPTRGYSVEFTGAAGFKEIKENSKLNDAVYDSLELETVQYSGAIISDTYFQMFPRGILNLGVQSAGIGGEGLFTNELLRFGGLRTLRGFDEESILASVYVMGKAEVRYIMEQNSFLFLFFNGAWYERNSNSGYVNDTPYGFGAGITFETKLGIFSVNYALGKEFENPIRFRAAKVHFGLVNYF
jgi:outer membrane protein assembly factor BamA